MKDPEVKKPVPADAELDAALARMAEEVPPMPADFHDRWMNAVRSEARGNAPAAEKPAPKNAVDPVRWTRILSVAAAFIFLIGGTLIYRDSKKSLSVPHMAEKSETAAADAGFTAEEADETADTAAYGEVLPEDPAAPMMGNAEEAFAPDAEAGTEEAEEARAAEEPAETEYAVNNAVSNAAPARKEAYAAEAPAPTAALLPTAEPVPDETGMPGTEEAAETAGETPAEGTGFLQAAGAFFTDMADFLLAALPYLLVLAVPAVIALVIRRKKAGRT